MNAITGRAGLLARGQAALRAGDMAGARTCFATMRGFWPDDPDALHGLACIALALGQADRAISLAGRARCLAAPGHPHLGQYHEVLARALLACGHGDAARAAIRAACLHSPDDGAIVLALAEIMERTGDIAAAEAAHARGVALGGVPARVAQARFWWRRGRGEVALAQMRHVAASAPHDGIAAHELVGMLLARDHRAEAETILRQRLARDGRDGQARSTLGALLFATGRLRPAATMLRAALRHDPAPGTANNLGLTLMALGEMAQAQAVLADACRAQPGDARIALNHATTLFESGQHAQARAAYEALLARSPAPDPATLARARFNMGVATLAQGHLAQGWALWESRLGFMPQHPAAHRLPRWQGQVLPYGRRLLVTMGQGLGDAVHFLRYVLLAAMRVPVVLEVLPALRRLAATLGQAADESELCRIEIITPDKNEYRGVACQCDLFSLPGLLGVRAVAPFRPYLGQAAWQPRRKRAGPLRVGLCHAGNAAYRFDARRSVAAEALAPLAQVEGVTFISLRPGRNPGTDPAFMRHELAADADLLETSRLVATLDLVISVDTLAAHLAGAMGCPVWLLSRFGGDWRWSAAFDAAEAGQAEGICPPVSVSGAAAGAPLSQWYDCVRVLRQPVLQSPGPAWQPVIAGLVPALRAWVAQGGGSDSDGFEFG
ncbi:flagellar protein FlbA [Komagataeibacter nataicola]|uniref:Flagellar protein FlbA n=1 Tax=Komagataeibacter nataicola TaxID=265960 RepID=A0A9N7CW26_9PROT|nr:tetratricopeptide repeat protein [Komagataeibacter nataicola]AQU88270.1 flagellar protein FlbA [Komagataeibacter nataicola]PYD67672.1 flagellar protein FlbA [Komagataeibacter nataicola]WEQ54626.1 tetratricopeptide repeat protein [Komagataeibacter nataicola]WNM08995.1 tetratricopeptide repeat protein [Komagataeibacter nataicola]GBR13863.1 O-linked N-acetylglucosamine transferase [Komagataeibacter nataicola NRIC 0616]